MRNLTKLLAPWLGLSLLLAVPARLPITLWQAAGALTGAALAGLAASAQAQCQGCDCCAEDQVCHQCGGADRPFCCPLGWQCVKDATTLVARCEPPCPVRQQCIAPCSDGEGDCYLGCCFGTNLICEVPFCIGDTCPEASRCGRDCCSEGETCVNDQCVGGCANPCGGNCCGAGQTCENDQCVTACADGAVRCGATCCTAGQTCENGQCVVACANPADRCGTTCCTAGQVCESGQCVVACANPVDRCGTTCCSPGQTCENGQCTGCAAGAIACGDLCCEAGSRCTTNCDDITGDCFNQCVADCVSGTTPCGATCCAVGESCENLQCVVGATPTPAPSVGPIATFTAIPTANPSVTPPPSPTNTLSPSPRATPTIEPTDPGAPTATPTLGCESNDEPECAIEISGVQFNASQDASTATTSPSDPQTCGSGQNSQSVWYRLTAASTADLRISTAGSDYDTVLTVWRGPFEPVTCNDNQSASRSARSAQSRVDFTAEAGITYHVEVSAFGSTPAGMLRLRVDPLCSDQVATIVGTEGADSLVGTGGQDVIVGLGGDDVLNGLGGNDWLCGDDGRDEILGGKGHDSVFGGAGDDTIRGEDGNDFLNGGDGTDLCDGGKGKTTLSGCP